MKAILRFAALCMLACCLCFSASAMEDVSLMLPVAGGNAEIVPVRVEDNWWLFLPAFADVDTLQVRAGGAPATLVLGEPEEEYIYPAEIALEDGETLEISVMQSANLRSVFLYSDDPVNQGRDYIDNCEKHVNRTTGSIAIVDAQGVITHADRLTQLRGRGNSTWRLCEKKAYQFKLENRADLLRTGDPAERNRTWVLMADAIDGTLLHNRVALDMALELGISETARSEHVDLYYDGEYRGTYLLCEKNEVNEGRIDIVDYDDLLETWNRKVGQYDLEALPVKADYNRFGSPFFYVDGIVESSSPTAGGYVVEMESETGTLSDRCWFRMTDGSALSIKNPENASEKMARYISERLEEARMTLQNGGVNPENGRTIEQDFNVEAFARMLLLHELTDNVDGYWVSSSFFVLPEGSAQFQPGAPWDFDLSCRYRISGANADGRMFKSDSGWLVDFYGVPSFRQRMAEIMLSELAPMVENILLGDQYGRYLKPLSAYAEEIGASERMNRIMWGTARMDGLRYGETFEWDLRLFAQFFEQRCQWLSQAIQQDLSDPNRIALEANAMYTQVESTVKLTPDPWTEVTVISCTWEQLTEADEENYAVWQLEAVIAPPEGQTFDTPEVYINEQLLSHERLEDGTLRICFTFEDPTYRPVDYDGEDLGLVYDYETYIRNHPEVVEICGEDPDAVLDYFYNEGMYLDHMANAFFRPSEIWRSNPEMDATLGQYWENYYGEFIWLGLEEGWLNKSQPHFWLEPVDAL